MRERTVQVRKVTGVIKKDRCDEGKDRSGLKWSRCDYKGQV